MALSEEDRKLVRIGNTDRFALLSLEKLNDSEEFASQYDVLRAMTYAMLAIAMAIENHTKI